MYKILTVIFIFSALLNSSNNSNAQCSNICVPLVYEGFDYDDNQLLNDLQGGTGFDAPWLAQVNGDISLGYELIDSSLSYMDLDTVGNSCKGGYLFRNIGRSLNTSPNGPFSPYLNNNNLIGNINTDLYVSAIMRKDDPVNYSQVWLGLHRSNLVSYVPNNGVSFGDFGNNSVINNINYWSLRIGGEYYLTDVPVVPGQESLLVMEIILGENDNHVINFWVNPATIAGTMPVPTMTQSFNLNLSFNALAARFGSRENDAVVDEIRIANSYECAVPDFNTPTNEIPMANFIMDINTGMLPLSVSFDATSSVEPDGTIDVYYWNFGDGNTSTSNNPTISHVYNDVGVFPVTLIVEDNCGTQSFVSDSIVVYDNQGHIPCLASASITNLASQGLADGSISFESSFGTTAQLINSAGDIFTPTNNEFTGLAEGNYTFTMVGNNNCTDELNLIMPVDNHSIPGWSPDICQMQLGINLNSIVYWNRIIPYKDFKKYSAEFTAENLVGGGNSGTMDEVPVDAQGYPLEVPYTTSAGEQAISNFISALGSMPAGDYVLLYDGEGVIGMRGNVITQSNTMGRIAFSVLGTLGVYYRILESTFGNHIRNIRILRLENEFDYQTEPYYLPFLQKTNEFTTLRFMDWAATNDSEFVHWSDRRLPDYHTQGQSNNMAVSYEYMIDLANRLQKDIWICVPHQADDNFITQMAQLFKDNLNSNLNIYLEYSNEVWNYQFAQFHWVRDNGLPTISHQRRFANRCKNVFTIWHNVFSETTDRVKRVVGTRVAQSQDSEQAMAQLKGEFDYISPTWYFGLNGPCANNLNSSSTPQDILDCARLSWSLNNDNTRRIYENARMYGVGVIEYEGGQHITGQGQISSYQTAIYDAQIAPGIKEIYNEVLDSIRIWGSELAVHFSFAGPRENPYGSWGALEYIEQDPLVEYAPKWEALIENINCYTPPVSIDVALPIELIKFEMQKIDCHYKLRWETLSELGSDKFEIEKSDDGINFYVIGEIKATGHSSQIQQYTFIDHTKKEGQLYYRLKQIDIGGQYKYSEIVGDFLNCNNYEISLYPNPTQNTLSFQASFLNNGVEIIIYNILGKEIMNLNTNQGKEVFEIDIKDLVAGTYFLKVKDANYSSKLIKFIKY